LDKFFFHINNTNDKIKYFIISLFFEFVYFFIDFKKLEKYGQIGHTQSNKSNNKIQKGAVALVV